MISLALRKLLDRWDRRFVWRESYRLFTSSRTFARFVLKQVLKSQIFSKTDDIISIPATLYY